MADQEMQNNAPDVQTKEPTGEASVTPFVDLGPSIFTFISFVVLALFVVGTPIDWATKRGFSNTTTLTLWGAGFYNSSGYSNSITVHEFTCPTKIQYFRTTEAFAILSIFAASLMLITGFASRAGSVSLKYGAVFSFMAIAFSLVAWAIGVRSYYLRFCDTDSYSQERYNIGPGAGLYVAGFCFSVVALVVAIRSPKVPAVIPDILLNTFASTAFVIAVVPAFVLSVVASPITVFSLWVNSTTQIKLTSWKVYTYVDGNQVAKSNWNDLSCGQIAATADFSAAFSILTIAACLVTLIAGVRYFRGGSRKTALIWSYIATLVGMIKMAADLSLYYRRFCDTQTFDALSYNMDAGFALSTALWVILLGASVFLTVISLSQYFAKSENTFSKMSVIFTFLILVSLVFVTIGASQPVIALQQQANWIKFYWWTWSFSLGTNTFIRFQDYPCQTLKDKMLAGGSLDIVAIGLTAITAVTAIGSFFNNILRKPAAVLGFVASIPMLVSWALGVSVFWGQNCDGSLVLYNNNYRLSTGLGLIVAAWCFTFISSICQFFIDA